MKLMTEAGIKAKPIETTKTINIPFVAAAFCLSFSVTGKAAVVTLNFKLGFPVAYFKIDSYIN